MENNNKNDNCFDIKDKDDQIEYLNEMINEMGFESIKIVSIGSENEFTYQPSEEFFEDEPECKGCEIENPKKYQFESFSEVLKDIGDLNLPELGKIDPQTKKFKPNKVCTEKWRDMVIDDIQEIQNQF